MSLHPTQAAVDREQARLASLLVREGSQLHRGRFSHPGQPRSWVDITDGALYLLIAAEPGQLQKQAFDWSYKQKVDQRAEFFKGWTLNI